MIYLIIFILIIVYSRFLNITKTRISSYILFSMPVFLLMLLVLGLQYNVGTDYYSYFNMAEGTKDLGFIANKSEQLFIYLIYLAQFFSLPQMIFFLAGTIQIVFLALITYEVKKMQFRMDYFFLLYFSLALVFFNQFNGIRQYIAVYIVVFAIFMLMQKKYLLFIVLVLISGFFHSSAFIFLGFLILPKLLEKRISAKYVVVFLSVLMVFSLYDSSGLIYRIVEFVPRYSHYIHASYMRKMAFTEIVTKIPKLMIVLFAALVIDRTEESSKYRPLINMAYISCAVMIASFSSTVIWRMYQYFDMFLIFPPLVMLQNNKTKMLSIFVVSALVAMLLIKIILMPTGEYMYRSILFN